MSQESRSEKLTLESNSSQCSVKQHCSFEDIEPAILPKPYPEIAVKEKNDKYAAILTNDFCGMVSELTAITEYINHEIRLSPCYCDIARTLLSIAQAEMIHLQMLGETILLLGGDLDYDAYTKLGPVTWTPDFVSFGTNVVNMLVADINGENKAICQYERHAEEIDDVCVKALLKRIVEDEKYHIELLTELLESLNNIPCTR